MPSSSTRAGHPSSAYTSAIYSSREVAAPTGDVYAGFAAVWTGAEAVFPSGDDAVLAYDPVADAWRSHGALDGESRIDASVAWADGVLLVWGGFQDRADGYMYRPGALPTSASLPDLRDSPIVAPPGGPPPSLVPVAGPDGATPGTVDLNAPPATIDGRRTDYRPVEDDNGTLVGYFGPCGYVSLEDFDPDADTSACGAAVTTSG